MLCLQASPHYMRMHISSKDDFLSRAEPVRIYLGRVCECMPIVVVFACVPRLSPGLHRVHAASSVSCPFESVRVSIRVMTPPVQRCVDACMHNMWPCAWIQVDIYERQRTTASMRNKPEHDRSARDERVPGSGKGQDVLTKTVTVSIVQPGNPDDMAGLPGVAAGGAGLGAGSPRDYNALLDEFSLHQFIIRRGATLSSTPEFESYRRKHARSWGPIQDCIALLEKLLAKYSVPIAYVDGNKLALLAQIDYRQPTTDDLLECLVNLDQVLEFVQVPGRRFKGAGKEANATSVLQAVYRGHMCRRGFRDAMIRFKSALVIQRYWKTILACRHTARVMARLEEERAAHFAALAQQLAQAWPELSRRKRVVVHLPSISREEAQRMSMHDFALRQNAQLARLTWAASTDVEVVYVSPFPLSGDVVQYYSKLLNIQGSERQQENFKIVFPENYDRFPSHLSIATVLLYSPRCLRRIANMCRGKQAYICPGVVGPDDLKLACQLDLPLLAPDPQVATVYTSKSGARRIFSLAEVNTPPGAYDLYNEQVRLMCDAPAACMILICGAPAACMARSTCTTSRRRCTRSPASSLSAWIFRAGSSRSTTSISAAATRGLTCLICSATPPWSVRRSAPFRSGWTRCSSRQQSQRCWRSSFASSHARSKLPTRICSRAGRRISTPSPVSEA